MEQVLGIAVVFTGIYMIIKVFTDFLLRRKLIIKDHIDKAGILEQHVVEERTYPTLKWGLIVLFGGLGLLIIALTNPTGLHEYEFDARTSFLNMGIELICISAGFLLSFVITRMMKK
ncbi:MAG TPA: hypothetical protein VK179_05415 [Bacteroidales bacterium]|nr:hypothetical protein [Bacteroidales bacterium]